MQRKKYSEAEKAAYWKKKAMAAGSGSGKEIVVVKGSRKKSKGSSKKAVAPYRGYGAYVGSALGGAIGTAVAPGVGTAIGIPLGGALGYAADKVFGWGDYKIEQNTFVHKGQPPVFYGPQYVRIRHREYIGDISSSINFTNTVYPINPSNATTFPWLSAVAEQFEQYRFSGLLFEFISTSADALNSTNTALGAVILATDYDAEDAPYVNQQQMLSATYANSGRPSANILHAVECAPDSLVTQWLYTRSSTVLNSSADARLYELGNFQVATHGSQAVATIGQLWVTYDVVFQKKQMNNVLGLALKSDKFIMNAPTTSAYFGTNYLGNTGVPGSSLGCTLTASQIIFPPLLSTGVYLIVYSVNGASTAITVPSVTPSGATVMQVWNNDSQLQSGSQNSITTSRLVLINIVKITDQGAVISYSGGTLPTSPTYGDLVITQLNGAIST